MTSNARPILIVTPAGGVTTRGATDTAASDPPMAQQADNSVLLSMLQELKDGQGAMNVKMDSLTTKVDLMQVRLGEIGARTAEAERRIGGVEDEVAQLTNKVDALEKSMKMVVEKAEDREGRSRRNNVRIVGIPEGRETGRFEVFIETLILQALSNPQLSTHFIIERAHRVPGSRPAPGAPPRAVIARVLNYRDRDAILRRAREMGEVPYEGSRLMFFPDFSQAVQRSRRSFDGVRRILRAKNIQYAMMFPSKLKVITDGTATFFTDPDRALAFAERLRSVSGPGTSASPPATSAPD